MAIYARFRFAFAQTGDQFWLGVSLVNLSIYSYSVFLSAYRVVW